MATTTRIALFGGVYSNHLALAAAIDDARARGCERLYCLGDLGAFGPHPDRVFPLLEDAGVQVVQGNYDDSVGNALDDCQCGYVDPQDNYFAKLSYDYTLANTSEENRATLRGLPKEIRFELGGKRVLLCHGSPRQVNEFLWESTSPPQFLRRLATAHEADIVVCTHTGIPWIRELPSDDGSPTGLWINCGALGRPPNDGSTEVNYAILEQPADPAQPATAEIVRLAYPFEELAREMEAEDLPKEFIETIRTGWWTTCLEILPSRERIAGRY